MPYFSIETNQALPEEAKAELLKKGSAFIAGLLEKPESYVMVAIATKADMIFGGNSEPTAFVQLKSLRLPGDRCAQLSAEVCGFLEKELDIPQGRVFIDFCDLTPSMFGWNGRTF